MSTNPYEPPQEVDPPTVVAWIKWFERFAAVVSILVIGTLALFASLILALGWAMSLDGF